MGGSLELPLVAGHRYTLVMTGQLQDHSVKSLLINETAEMKIGAKPTDAVVITVDTFLTAIKTAGLTEELARGGPHLVLAPIDEAFAALPKEKRDALMADPKALGDLLPSFYGHASLGTRSLPTNYV